MNIDVIVRNRNNDKTGGEENEKNPWYCFTGNWCFRNDKKL